MSKLLLTMFVIGLVNVMDNPEVESRPTRTVKQSEHDEEGRLHLAFANLSTISPTLLQSSSSVTILDLSHNNFR